MAKRKKRRKANTDGKAIHLTETNTTNSQGNSSQRPGKTPELPGITGPKLLRLALKSMLFALLVSTVVTLLSLLNVPVFRSLWFQFAVMLGVYLLAYPYLMREFRSVNTNKRAKKHGR